MPNFPTFLPKNVIQDDDKQRLDTYLSSFEPLGHELEKEKFNRFLGAFKPLGEDMTPPTLASNLRSSASNGPTSSSNAPDAAPTPRDLLSEASHIAREKGFDEDAAKAVQAILRTEGAMNGEIGDAGKSHGPFQFHEGGMLPAYAKSLGVDIRQAAEYTRQNPQHAIDWALGGYLGNAIREGQAKGLRGAELATYAQQHGQRSQSPERAGQNYNALFGGNAPIAAHTPAATPRMREQAIPAHGRAPMESVSEGREPVDDRTAFAAFLDSLPPLGSALVSRLALPKQKEKAIPAHGPSDKEKFEAFLGTLPEFGKDPEQQMWERARRTDAREQSSLMAQEAEQPWTQAGLTKVPPSPKPTDLPQEAQDLLARRRLSQPGLDLTTGFTPEQLREGQRQAGAVTGALPQAMGQVGEGALNLMNEADRPFVNFLIRLGDFSTDSPRNALVQAYMSESDPARKIEIGKEYTRAVDEATKQGFTGLVPKGTPRSMAGLMGEFISDYLTGNWRERVAEAERDPEAAQAKLAEEWQRWGIEETNPMLELLGGVANPMWWAIEPVQGAKILVEMGKGVPGAVKGVTSAARQAAPRALEAAGQAGRALGREAAGQALERAPMMTMGGERLPIRHDKAWQVAQRDQELLSTPGLWPVAAEPDLGLKGYRLPPEPVGGPDIPGYQYPPTVKPHERWTDAEILEDAVRQGATAPERVRMRLLREGQAPKVEPPSIEKGEVQDVGKGVADTVKRLTEQGYTVATKMPDNPAFRDVVERTLARAQEQGRPAIVIDNVVYLSDGKYVIGQEPGGQGRFELQKVHDLSESGFLRGLESSYDSTGEWSSYNRAAQEMIERTKAERKVEQEARAAREATEREAQQRTYEESQALRQTLDEQLAGTKFGKLKTEIALLDGSKTTIEGPYLDGLIIHKQVAAQGRKMPLYAISHAASGMGLGMDFATQTQAKVAAMRLAGVFDWTRPITEVTDEVKAKVVPYIKAMRSGDAYAVVEGVEPTLPKPKVPPTIEKPPEAAPSATQAEGEAARANFEQEWQESYGNRPETEPIVKPERAVTPQPELTGEEARKVAKMTDAELAEYNAKKAGGAAKEPWEMSAEDYVNANIERVHKSGENMGIPAKTYLLEQHAAAVEAAMQQGKSVFTGAKPVWQRTQADHVQHEITQMKAAGNPQAETPEMLRVLVNEHKQDVQSALEDKWSVPDEVLADYPDLLKQYGKPTPIGSSYKAPPEAPKPDYGGFLDTKPPMARKVVEKTLDISVMNEGKPISRKALVERMIDEGATVQVAKNGERRLMKPDGAFLSEKQISKTGMDYAEHLAAKVPEPTVKPQEATKAPVPNMAARAGLIDADEPIPSWATESRAFKADAEPYRSEWITTSARLTKLGNGQLSATWYGANHVAIGDSSPKVRLFLQEALGRQVEPYREGWLVTADEAAWLGFAPQDTGIYTARDLAAKAQTSTAPVTKPPAPASEAVQETRYQRAQREERELQARQLENLATGQASREAEEAAHISFVERQAKQAAEMSYDELVNDAPAMRGLMEWYYTEIGNTGMASRMRQGDTIPRVELSKAQRLAQEKIPTGEAANAAPTSINEPLTEPPPIKETGPIVEQGKPIRFEAGKKLTEQERKQVLHSIGDVYKEKGAQKVLKGIDQSGEERYGYEYSPDLFEQSAITGKPIRYYIKLPDGRIAHPSELFPEMTDSAIEKALAEERYQAQQAAYYNEQRLKRVIPGGTEDAENAANAIYSQRGRPREGSYFAKNDEGQLVRVDGQDAEDVKFFEEQGFKAITEPVPMKGQGAEPPAKRTTEVDIPGAPEQAEALKARVQEIGTKEDYAKRAINEVGEQVRRELDEGQIDLSGTPDDVGRRLQTRQDELLREKLRAYGEQATPSAQQAAEPPKGPPSEPPKAPPGATPEPPEPTPRRGDLFGDTRLSSALRGAKPHYGFGNRQFQLAFKDNINGDIDMAFYIVAQEKLSKRDADYMAFLQGLFPGMSEAALRERGRVVRGVIKQRVKNAKPGILNVPDTGSMAELERWQKALPSTTKGGMPVPDYWEGMVNEPFREAGGAAPPSRVPLWKKAGTKAEPPLRGGEPPKEPPGPPPELPSGKVPGGPEGKPSATIPDQYALAKEALTPDEVSLMDRVRAIMRATYDREFDLGDVAKRSGIPVHEIAQVANGAIAAGEATLTRDVLPAFKVLRGSEPELLTEWMVQQRNRDILAKYPHSKLPGGIMGWSGISKVEAEIARKAGKDGMARIESVGRKLWDLNRTIKLQVLLNAGLINKKQLVALTSSHPHFIPFNRLDYTIEDTLYKAFKPSPGSVVDNSIEFLTKTGSEMKLDKPMDNFLSGFIHAERLAARNKTANTIVEAFEKIQAGLPKGAEPTIWEIKAGAPIVDTNKYGTLVAFKDGKPRYYAVPYTVAKIATGAEAEPMGMVMSLAAKTTTPLRLGAVTYNPGWPVVNAVFLDGINALYREGLVPFSPQWVKGMVSAVKQDKLWYDAAHEGALMSGIAETFIGTDALKRAGWAMTNSFGIRNWKDVAGTLPRLIKRAGEISEQGTRIAVWDMLKQQGVQWPTRAVRARDASYDMRKAGNVLRTVNMIWPFVNPGIQGAANTLRLLKDNKKQAAIGWSIISMPSIYAYVSNAQFETAKDVPLYLWERSWPLIIGEGTEAPDPEHPNAPPKKFPLIQRIPKPPVAAVLTAPVEFVLHVGWRIDDRSVLDYLGQAWRTASIGLLPVDPSYSSVFPPLAETGIGIATGKDLYRGMDIVPRREQARPPELQYGPETSETAVLLGKQFNVSPRTIDWATKNYTAGAGATGLWTADLILGALGIKTEEAPGLARRQQLTDVEKLSKTPVVSRFFSTAHGGQEDRQWDAFNKAVEDTKREFTQIPEVRRLGVNLGPVGQSIEGVELTLPERTDYQRLAVKAEALLVNRMVASPLYQQQKDDVKVKLLQSAMQRARTEIGLNYLNKLGPKVWEQRLYEQGKLAR